MEITARGGGVVIGDCEEIQPGLLCRFMQQLGRALGVRVESMTVQITAIPAGTLTHR
jgi:hypothetical protein